MPHCTSIRRQLLAAVAAAPITLAMAIAVFLPSTATAQPSGGMSTVAVIAASDYEQLIADIDKLGELGGQVKAGQQMEGMLNLFTQNRGLQGLDKTKPWGAVVQTDGIQFIPVICVPVTDLASLLELPTMFQMKTSSAGEGITEIEIPNQSIYVKDGNGWAFIAQQAEQLDASPDNPTKLFADLTSEYDLAARLMVQNIPEMFRSIAIQNMRSGLEQGMRQLPGESDEDYNARRDAANAQIEQLAQVINDLDELVVGFNYDNAKGNLQLDFASKPVAGTDFAAMLPVYESATTAFAGCLDESAPVRFNMCVQVLPEIAAKYADQTKAQLQAMRKQALNAIDNSGKFPNEAARETMKSAVDELMDAVEATFISGKFDVAGHVDMSAESLKIVAGGYMLETAKVESAAKKVAAMMEGQPGFPGVQWNAATHGGSTIHTMSIPVPAGNDVASRMMGESLDIAVALGKESIHFAAGQDSMANVKQAIDGSGGSQSVMPMQLSIALQPIVQTIFEIAPPGTPMLADINEALITSGGEDHIHMTLKAEGGMLRGRLELESGVLKTIGAGVMAARMQGVGAGF